MLTFNSDGMVRQRFPFKDPIMDYIFKHLKPEHLIKLYQCSKYFYAKFRRNIIRHLEIVPFGHEETLDPTNCVITARNLVLSAFEDCWITDSFVARASWILLPKFNHCNIKKLELCNLISWKEYVTLTKSGTVEELKILKGVYMSALYDIRASVEQLLGQVPNAKSVEIYESFITPTTFSSLVSLKHRAKISNLVLKNMTSAILFEDDLMADFVLVRTFFFH